MKIVGLAGSFASGKDLLARYLVHSYDALHVSTSDLVRDYAMEKYHSNERSVLARAANELRETEGPSVLVKRSLASATEKRVDVVVVSGVRSTAEAALILSEGGTMLFVDAPITLRYKRIQGRRRAGEDMLTLEQFRSSEEAEYALNKDDDPTKQNLGAVKRMSNAVLQNDLSVGQFYARARKILHLEKK
jgi:dephospho-CoA kinase